MEPGWQGHGIGDGRSIGEGNCRFFGLVYRQPLVLNSLVLGSLFHPPTFLWDPFRLGKPQGEPSAFLRSPILTFPLFCFEVRGQSVHLGEADMEDELQVFHDLDHVSPQKGILATVYVPMEGALTPAHIGRLSTMAHLGWMQKATQFCLGAMAIMWTTGN